MSENLNNSLPSKHSLSEQSIRSIKKSDSMSMLLDRLESLSVLDSMPDISDFVKDIYAKLLFVDVALTMCTRENLKLSTYMREEEAALRLGYVCLNEKCGKTQSVLATKLRKCCFCGADVRLRYLQLVDKLHKLNIFPTPETVLMWASYDALTKLHQAFQRVLKIFVDYYDCPSIFQSLQFVDTNLKDNLAGISKMLQNNGDSYLITLGFKSYYARMFL